MFSHYPSEANSNSNDVMGNAKEVEVCNGHTLTRLDGSAFQPEVDDHRVTYEGANGGYLSDMTMAELQSMANFYPWPRGVKLRLPCTDGRSLARYPGCFVIYKESLRAGFRLPLHPFIADFLFDAEICPAQLTPVSWRWILAFLLKCKKLNLAPSYEAFKLNCEVDSFDPRAGAYPICGLFCRGVGSFMKITSDHQFVSLDKKWFLVSPSEIFHFNFPMYPGRCCMWNGVNDNKVQDFMKVFTSSLCRGPDSMNVSYPYALEDAGLSLPHPGTVQVDQRNRKVQEVECSWAEPGHMEGPSKNARTSPSQLNVENTCINSARVEGGNEVTHDSGEPSRIGALCREVSTALGRFPELILAAQHSEELERQLNESRRENVKLKRDKAEVMQQLSASRRRETKLSDELAGKEREFQSRMVKELLNFSSLYNFHHEEEEEEEEEDPEEDEEEPEDTPISSSRLVNGEVDVSSQGGSSISTLCRPEVSAALKRLPEILMAAHHSEDLQSQLSESRKEVVELRREKGEIMSQITVLRRRERQLMDEAERKEREFQLRIERMEVGSKLMESRSKLMLTTQKAKELLEISTPLLKFKHS